MTEDIYDVFLCYNSKDKAAVEPLAYRLRDAFRVFYDLWELIPGRPFQEQLEAALGTSQTYAVFLGSEGLGPWQNEEMRDALAERVRHDDFRVIPVLLHGASKPGDDDLPRFLRRLTWVDMRHGLGDGSYQHRASSWSSARSRRDRSTPCCS